MTETDINEKIIAILGELIKEIQCREEKCFEKMEFCDEHKFELEREAIRYSQQAYNRSRLAVSEAKDKIAKLINKKQQQKNEHHTS